MQQSYFYPLREKRTFEYAQESVSREGIQLVREYVESITETESAYAKTLPDDFDARWIIARGEYAGTFPKRVSAWLWKVHGIRLTPEQLSQVGNIARAHSSKVESYILDFTNKFNWHSGDFGDEGSCYWGDHSYARTMLADNDSLAVRLYNADHSGYARAWLVFPTSSDEINDNDNHRIHPTPRLAVLYNAYGIESIRLARIIATMFGLSYKKIELLCNGETTGTLWINHNDPNNENAGTHKAKNGSGYAIGAAEELEHVVAVDLQWAVNEYSCEACGAALAEDECYTNDSGGTYCDSCYHERYTHCDRCDRECSNDDTREVEGNWWCEFCVENFATRCNDCDEFVRNSHITEIRGDSSVCRDCRESYYRCEGCGEYCEKDDVTTIDDETYCDDCIDKHYPQCDNCEKRTAIADLKEYEAIVPLGNYNAGALTVRHYCETCARERELMPEQMTIDPAQMEMGLA